MESPKSTDTMITGRKGSIGPARPRPSSSLPQPHWKIATTTPKAAATAATFIAAAFSGMPMERKASSSSTTAEADDDADEEGQLADDDVGEVVVAGGHAADLQIERGARSRRAAAPRRAAGRRGRWSSGTAGRTRDDGEVGGVAVGVVRHRGRRGDALGGAERGVEVVEGEPVLGAVDVGDEGQRAVHAGSEAVREQVVGLPGGGGLRVVALVGGAQVQGERRAARGRP